MTKHNQVIGKWGERIAEEYLCDHGYTILEKNHRTPFGEIDIITMESGMLVFVEVKTRTSTYLGNPEGSMTFTKQKHILDSAQHFLMNSDQEIDGWRVDVVAITGKPDDLHINIELFKNALYS